ncbi:MAG: TIR domain-containing protein [Chloroflexi bacterium]|nr:TIR domain-containing protein [Chloroflexota bacterium]
MGYLFVSYSRHDRRSDPIIDKILYDLRSAGVSLWLVPDDLPPGIDWNEAKPEGLRNAAGLLYLFGRSLSKTKQIAAELATARELGLPITVVVVNDRRCRAAGTRRGVREPADLHADGRL